MISTIPFPRPQGPECNLSGPVGECWPNILPAVTQFELYLQLKEAEILISRWIIWMNLGLMFVLIFLVSFMPRSTALIILIKANKKIIEANVICKWWFSSNPIEGSESSNGIYSLKAAKPERPLTIGTDSVFTLQLVTNSQQATTVHHIKLRLLIKNLLALSLYLILNDFLLFKNYEHKGFYIYKLKVAQIWVTFT